MVSLSPNPATTILSVKTTNAASYSIAIINTLGQTVRYVAATEQELVIDVVGLPPGLYVVVVTDKMGNRYFEKVMIEAHS